MLGFVEGSLDRAGCPLAIRRDTLLGVEGDYFFAGCRVS